MSYADSLTQYRDVRQTTTRGIKENCSIQMIDRFGNKLRSAFNDDSYFIMDSLLIPKSQA